jgi:CSLREA domain-containing protein
MTNRPLFSGASLTNDRIAARSGEWARRSVVRFRLAAIITTIALTIASAASAATITVTTLDDPTGVSGTCSLHDAITAANSQMATNHCSAGTGSDTIVFSLTGTISLVSTLPTITRDLTITGPTTSPGITIDGGGKVQLIQVDSGATLNLQFLTLARGSVTGGSPSLGGGINNNGTLTVSNSTFSANQATGVTGSISGGSGLGGAIFNNGTLTITNSTFSTNQATGGLGGRTGSGLGGAIFNKNKGTLTVTNSTFSANQATGGDPGGRAHGGAI